MKYSPDVTTALAPPLGKASSSRAYVASASFSIRSSDDSKIIRSPVAIDPTRSRLAANPTLRSLMRSVTRGSFAARTTSTEASVLALSATSTSKSP